MVDRWNTGRWTIAAGVGLGLGLGLLGRALLGRPQEADLRGQVALVTGGSRGLGFLLARELAREGCRIAICARGEAGLAHARESLAETGADVLAVRCDVADRPQVERLVEEVSRRFGRVDLLVNNAGIIQVGPLENQELSDFETALGVMFWGTLYPTLAVLPQMLERGAGRIVNITSIGGKVSVPHLLPYNCAKFAAVGLSEGLRAELAGRGVTVTTVVPGLLRTGSYLNALFKGRRPREYTWFSLGASLPFISMDAERAARQIVQATKRGDAETTLSLPASLLARFHGLFPGTNADLLGLVNRFVLPPPAEDGRRAEPGRAVQEEAPSPIRDALTAWGRSAARRFHEYPAAPAERRDRGAA